MKLFKELAIILAIWMIGEWISKVIGIPIPGTVIGMLILFFMLILGVIKVDMLEELSDFLLTHLSFFLIPPAVAFISIVGLLKNIWLQTLIIIIVSTILIIITSGYTVQLMIDRRGKNERVNK